MAFAAVRKQNPTLVGKHAACAEIWGADLTVLGATAPRTQSRGLGPPVGQKRSRGNVCGVNRAGFSVEPGRHRCPTGRLTPTPERACLGSARCYLAGPSRLVAVQLVGLGTDVVSGSSGMTMAIS